jgi:single-strand DNA-binding protein
LMKRMSAFSACSPKAVSRLAANFGRPGHGQGRPLWFDCSPSFNLSKKIATLSIATSESWKDQQSSEWCERTEWHRVVVFNEGLAKIVEKHLTSGMKVRIEGKLRTRKWQDQSGQDRYSIEIHVENYGGSINFDVKRDDDRPSGGAGRESARESATAGAGGSTGAGLRGGDLDDDIPFAPCWQ